MGRVFQPHESHIPYLLQFKVGFAQTLPHLLISFIFCMVQIRYHSDRKLMHE